MDITSSVKSISELFEGNSTYVIPNYQRPYRWTDEHIEQLWDDIYEAFVSEEKNYFLGSIITVQKSYNNTRTYEVVDGQQRLTTLTILFCVIRDMFPSLDAKSDNGINAEIIKQSIIPPGRSHLRLRFSANKEHQSDFEKYISKRETADGFKKKPYKKELKKDEQPKYKFINTRYILFNKLKEMEKERKVEEFIEFLFYKVQIIHIGSKNTDSAFNLFQVLNTRGLNLTTSDLIKSFLLEQLHNQCKGNMDAFKKKEERFMEDWRSIEQAIIDTNNDIKLDHLFSIYAYYKSGRKPKKKRYYNILKDVFEKEKNPNEIIKDIKSFIETYVNEIHKKEDKVLYALRYLAGHINWKAILLTALKEKYKESDYDELKEELCKFNYLYWLAGKKVETTDTISSKIIDWLKKGEEIGDIKSLLNRDLENSNIIELARNNLVSSQAASKRWIKPLLLLIEYNATDDSKLSFISAESKGKSPLQLEHILPISFKSENWGNNITKQDADKWKNSIGNITLLSGTKNKQASNNPFEEKIKIYRGENNTRKEKKTAFSITQNIITDFDTNKYDKQWNIYSMRDRFKWFLAEVKEILKEDALVDDDIHEPKTV